MKVKTSKLTGAALDWAVAKCEGVNAEAFRLFYEPTEPSDYDSHGYPEFHYSTTWSQGGPIIEREIGNLWKHNKLDPNEPDVWTAAAYRKAPDGTALYYEDGPTPLIAAMRCYVASKLGDEVDVPEELA